MNIIEQKSLAARLLKLTEMEVEENSGFVDDVEALFVSVPTKDGKSILVGNDGTVLFGNSAWSFSMLLKAFKNGERTPLDFFDV